MGGPTNPAEKRGGSEELELPTFIGVGGQQARVSLMWKGETCTGLQSVGKKERAHLISCLYSFRTTFQLPEGGGESAERDR